ncbi:hypothetical protein SPRG_07290 [Saprolegnia parasitica CBS 223.65]|uniref:Uncharacterized protein n=1 Tax=Saprolegnia parasitica (strain CBS 223.65) TaxID=695850 RepID=A0A067CER0_SAPPC|nr:hypothetical protein SPRG_07290 [Saprolegnia parasitica CBS 223.65]KDO27660.1 hypothetical protein SPRG_07290 [Saprolegnia parasitica CBS 223.65]|eukprot:XP_012201473.1 hypothetical protein SPRG_07290 [Saprolegnia parasitica CBS 223.65]
MGPIASTVRGCKVSEDVVTLKKIKVLLLGGPRVGKTSIFYRLLRNHFEPSASRVDVGVNIGLKSIALDGGPTIVIEMWDVPSTPHLSKDRAYLEGADAVIFVASTTDASSCKHVQAYYDVLQTMYPSPDHHFGLPAVVFQSKADCPIKQPLDAGDQMWHEQVRLDCFPVSAKTNEGLGIALKLLLVHVLPPRDDASFLDV